MKPKSDIVAILLAAGASSRMRGTDKLLAHLIDKDAATRKTLLRHVAEQLSAAQIQRLIVVVRADIAKYEQILSGLAVEIIVAPHAADGMSQSLKAGIGAAGPSVGGYLIALADMPALTKDHYNKIVSAFKPTQAQQIIRPQTKDGRFGHPVCFSRDFFDALSTLDGDQGARNIIKRYPKRVQSVMMDDAIHIDLDTPEAWAEWHQ